MSLLLLEWLGTVSPGAMEYLGYCDNSRPACFLDVTMCKACQIQWNVLLCQSTREPWDIAKMPNTFKQCFSTSWCIYHGFGQASSKYISQVSGLEKATFSAPGWFVLVPGPPLWYQALPMTNLAPARRRLQCTTLSIRAMPGNSYCVYYYKLPQAPFLATAGFPPFSHPPARLQTLK